MSLLSDSVNFGIYPKVSCFRQKHDRQQCTATTSLQCCTVSHNQFEFLCAKAMFLFEIMNFADLSVVFSFQAECQNHIRVVAKLTKEKLLLCGTHAYRPRCRHYFFKVRKMMTDLLITINELVYSMCAVDNSAHEKHACILCRAHTNYILPT